MGTKSSKPQQSASSSDQPVRNYPPLNPKLIKQLPSRYMPVFLPAQITGEAEVQLINQKGYLLPEGMNGFEKVFKDGRAGGLHLRIPNKPRRSTCPSIRAMEAELKKLKEESFAMKCTLKATDTVYNREFQILQNLKEKLEEQAAPPANLQPKNIK